MKNINNNNNNYKDGNNKNSNNNDGNSQCGHILSGILSPPWGKAGRGGCRPRPDHNHDEDGEDDKNYDDEDIDCNNDEDDANLVVGDKDTLMTVLQIIEGNPKHYHQPISMTIFGNCDNIW